MNKILGYAQRLAGRSDSSWRLDRTAATVTIDLGPRHQTVKMQRVSDEFVLSTVVLGTRRVCKDDDVWRELARLAWLRNAEHELVTFGFDRHDRLIGQIRHPVDQLDYAEFEAYVVALARECDRFEYLLTGQDVF